MKNRVLLVFLLCGILLPVFAQTWDINQLKIGVDARAALHLGKFKRPDRVRAYNTSDYPRCNPAILLPWLMTLTELSLGVQAEYPFWKKRLAVSSGLRFSQYQNWDGIPGDIFWLLNEEGQSSHNVMIKSINQKRYYIGIPMDIKVFPYKREHRAQAYLKLGGVINFRVYENNRIDFYQADMNKYEGMIKDQIKDLENRINICLDAAVGIKMISPSQKSQCNMEWFMSMMLSHNDSAFFTPDDVSGLGVRLLIQFPARSKSTNDQSSIKTGML